MAAGLALVVALAVVTTVVMSAGSPSPSRTSSKTGASGAATVRRRNLVETDTEAGTLSYSDPQTVYNRLSGTITWLPGVGQLIKPGGALYDVNGEPVILMNGSTPAYRTLSASDDSGSDVLQLNRNLVEMGFNADGITVDDVWQPGTTLGVELLQESLGEAETGSLPLGQIVFLPGVQLVSAVDGTVGATGGGSGSGTAAVTAVTAGAPEFVSLTVGDRRPTSKTAGARTTSATTASVTSATTPAPDTPAPRTPGTPATPPGTTPGTPTTTTPATTTTTGTPTTTPATMTTTMTTTTTPAMHGTPTPTSKPPATGSPTGAGGQVSARTLAALTALLKAEAAQLKAETEELNSARRASATGHGGGGNGKSGSSRSSSGAKSTDASGLGSSTGLGSATGGEDSGGGSAAEILQTTSTRLVVTVDLSASSQSEAVVGERVTVEMPAGNTVDGRITAVSTVAQSSSGSGNGNGSSGGGSSGSGGGGGGGGGSGSGGSSSTIPVTVTLSGHHVGVGLDQATVSVSFAEQRAANVLSVPVTALLATGGGNYAVQAAVAPHQLIPVTTGLFAAGYVQISGPGIHTGLQVTDSQG
jgi:hypothetical protein